jgi:hypothetical protein
MSGGRRTRDISADHGIVWFDAEYFKKIRYPTTKIHIVLDQRGVRKRAVDSGAEFAGSNRIR